MIIDKTIFYRLNDNYYLVLTEHFQVRMIERIKNKELIFKILNELKNLDINRIKAYINKDILLKYEHFNIYAHLKFNKNRKRFEVELISLTMNYFNGHYDIKANLTELSTIY